MPKGDDEALDQRVVRIETRLVKYQESNALQMDEVLTTLRELKQEIAYIRAYVEQQTRR